MIDGLQWLTGLLLLFHPAPCSDKGSRTELLQLLHMSMNYNPMIHARMVGYSKTPDSSLHLNV